VGSSWARILSLAQPSAAGLAESGDAMDEVKRETETIAENLLSGLTREMRAVVDTAVVQVKTCALETLLDAIKSQRLTRLRAGHLFATVAGTDAAQLMTLDAERKTRIATWEALLIESQKNKLNAGMALASAIDALREVDLEYIHQVSPTCANITAMAALWKKCTLGQTRKSMCEAARQNASVHSFAFESLRKLLDRACNGQPPFEEATVSASF
jgi:hypothetical protein